MTTSPRLTGLSARSAKNFRDDSLWIRRAQALQRGDVLRYRLNLSNEVLVVVLGHTELGGLRLKLLFDSEVANVRGVYPHEVIAHIDVPEEWDAVNDEVR